MVRTVDLAIEECDAVFPLFLSEAKEYSSPLKTP